MGTKTQKLSNVVDQIVQWQSVVVADGSTGLTAVAGRGYFIDTTSGAITVTLPASPKIGDTIIINDYASTFATNNVTINLNGNKMEASTSNGTLSTNDQTHTLVYTDSTQGWKIVNQDTASAIQPTFISATGGTVTTSGDYKIHTFTGDGCFVVSSLGAGIPCAQASTVDYLVVAGGGGANGANGGGAGGGGMRFSNSTCMPSPTTDSSLANPTGLTISATTYPVTVGGGGAAGPAGAVLATSGSNSTFSTITSAGGGFSGGRSTFPINPVGANGTAGGSGGGGGGECGGSGGAGNTPPVNPPQGKNGGNAGSGSCRASGGGGGAAAAGVTGSSQNGGNGGSGSYVTGTGFAGCNGTPGPICGARYFAGGGGGGVESTPALGLGSNGSGGTGGGGQAGPAPNVTGAGQPGTANTGGGGGGGSRYDCGSAPLGPGGAGGKGIVVIRYKFQ